MYDDQVCLLREARSLLRSVQHDVAELRRLRAASDPPTPHASDLELHIKLTDERLEFLAGLRHRELETR